jgi:hypothetical protein
MQKQNSVMYAQSTVCSCSLLKQNSVMHAKTVEGQVQQLVLEERSDDTVEQL